jgi:hypothetical protein
MQAAILARLANMLLLSQIAGISLELLGTAAARTTTCSVAGRATPYRMVITPRDWIIRSQDTRVGVRFTDCKGGGSESNCRA